MDKTLFEQWAEEYSKDPEFIAEGLSIGVIEKVLEKLEELGKDEKWLFEHSGMDEKHYEYVMEIPSDLSLLDIVKLAMAVDAEIELSLIRKS